jgi:hypothetical protein
VPWRLRFTGCACRSTFRGQGRWYTLTMSWLIPLYVCLIKPHVLYTLWCPDSACTLGITAFTSPGAPSPAAPAWSCSSASAAPRAHLFCDQCRSGAATRRAQCTCPSQPLLLARASAASVATSNSSLASLGVALATYLKLICSKVRCLLPSPAPSKYPSACAFFPLPVKEHSQQKKVECGAPQ